MNVGVPLPGAAVAVSVSEDVTEEVGEYDGFIVSLAVPVAVGVALTVAVAVIVGVGVHDAGADPPQRATEPPQGQQVLDRRDPPGHRDPVNGEALLVTERGQVRTG